jgi:hypothetical protein
MAQFIPIALSAAGSIVQGVGGLKANQRARRIGERNALEVENVSADESLRVRAEARQAIGQQLAGQYGNGFEGGSGSALDYVFQSQVNASLDAMTVLRDGATRAKAIRQQKPSKSAGYMALAKGIIGAGTAIAGGVDDWAGARKGQIPVGSS